mgnify:CR=1 FL=1
MNRKLRMGMVGGGRGAFIGQVHRMAANLDGKIELVAGGLVSVILLPFEAFNCSRRKICWLYFFKRKKRELLNL